MGVECSVMNLLMISGDRSVVEGKRGAFWYMLEEFCKHWDRIDIICPAVKPAIRVMPDGVASEPYQMAESRNPSFFKNVYFYPSPKGLWYQPAWIVKKGRELFGKYKHDVMSVHEYPPFYNGMGAEYLSRKTRIPYVLEVHHIVGYPRASSFTEWIGRIMSHLFLANDTYGAKAVRCVNNETAEILRGWGSNADDVFVIPSFYLNKDALKSEFCEKKYDVVCCGRLAANKGLGDVLEAIALMNDATCLIIGDGSLGKFLKNKAKRLGIAERVTFAGWLPESSDVYRAVKSAKIFVMNSRSEGGPRVALEAMALAMPIISTKVGVMPDIVIDGENGLFTNGSPGDLASKISKMLDYPALRKRIGEGARNSVERFEKTRLIREYAEFLQSCAAA